MPPKKKRRLSSGVECHLQPVERTAPQSTIAPSSPKTKRSRLSISGRQTATNFTFRIAEIYNEGIQLGTKNKINQNNAWTVKLLDVMDKVLEVNVNGENKKNDKNPSNSVCNFKVASNTLDTSVKIYSCRVDSVHKYTYQVLNGLNRSSKPQRGIEDDEENEDGIPDGTNNENNDNGNSKSDEALKKAKKRRVLSLANTLDSVANLGVKKMDLEFSVDPLFHKTAAAFDEGGAKGLLLGQLGVSVGCNVVFDSTEYHPEEIKLSNERYDVSILRELVGVDWTTATICPEFEQWSFYRSDEPRSKSMTLPDIDIGELNTVDEDDDDDFSYEFLSQHSQFSSTEITSQEMVSMPGISQNSEECLLSQLADLNLGEPMSQDFTNENEENPFSQEDGENGHHDFSQIESINIEGDHYEPPQQEEDFITRILEGPSATPTVDALKVLLDSADDYKYFNSKLIQNWAGPEHWKFKPVSNKPLNQNGVPEAEEKAKRPRGRKQEFFLNFLEEDNNDYDELFQSFGKKGATLSKDSLLELTEPTTLPFVDMHYDVRLLTQLFCKPGKTISFRNVSSEPNDGSNETGLFAHSNNVDGSEETLMPEPLPFDYVEGVQAEGGDDMDDNDDEGFGAQFAPDWNSSGTENFYENQVVPSQPFSSQAYSMDDLIDEPEKVRHIKITHAKRAKRVDIDKLKGSIWRELCAASPDEENQTPNTQRKSLVINEDITEKKMFSEILESLPASVPESHLADLSVPLCFICLLDLANKKGLQIDQKGSDLTIQKYVSVA